MLTEPEWQNTTVISSDVADRIAKLKEETDGTVLVAGAARSSRHCSARTSWTSCG